MVSAQTILAAIAPISGLIFVAFFGKLPLFRHTPIAFLHRLICRIIPQFFRDVFRVIDRVTTGGRPGAGFARVGRWVTKEKNPLVMIFFLTLLTGGSGLFLHRAWLYLFPSQRLLSFVLLAPPYIFLYLCNKTTPSSPHIINKASHAEQKAQYPYDYKLFHPGTMCYTCNLEKPARSKHCKFCKSCIARCDHHCIWINNCVGRGNYKYFLGLLLSTHILLVYASYLAYSLLKPAVLQHYAAYPQYHEAILSDYDDFFSRMASWLFEYVDVFATALDIGGVSVGGVGGMAFLTCLLPLGLFTYHVYLIYAGTTTNESAKWSDWEADIKDDVVWLANLDPNSQHLKNQSHRWTKHSKHFMVYTKDGQEPRHLVEGIVERLEHGTDAKWNKIKSLKEIDNTYDMGFWRNLVDILTD